MSRLAGSWYRCGMCNWIVFKTGDRPKRSCPRCGCKFGQENWGDASRSDVSEFMDAVQAKEELVHRIII
jgi:hypothetical protein